MHQGISAELLAEKWNISRVEVDGFSAESHARASAAIKAGRHKEIIPTPGLDAEGKHISLTWDEGVRDKIDPAKMAALPTIFRPAGNGVVTAANSSQISDGAAAVLVANREVAEADGFKPRARFRARVVVGSDPTDLTVGGMSFTVEVRKVRKTLPTTQATRQCCVTDCSGIVRTLLSGEPSF